jgi:hypothetical protein
MQNKPFGIQLNPNEIFPHDFVQLVTGLEFSDRQIFALDVYGQHSFFFWV